MWGNSGVTAVLLVMTGVVGVDGMPVRMGEVTLEAEGEERELPGRPHGP